MRKNFYGWLYTIDGTGNPTPPFLVDHRVPFLEAKDAVEYVMRERPDDEPMRGIIEGASRDAAAIAGENLHETEFLLKTIEQMRDEAREKSSETWEKVNVKPKDILGSCTREVLREKALRETGTASGLSDAWLVLHRRAYELYRISTMRVKE